MHWYLDPIKNHYFDFKGTVGRRPFWMFILLNFGISVVLAVIGSVIKQPLISTVYALAVLLPALGMEVRRLHDIGKSGWWVLISLVPILGALYLLYLFAQPSSTPYVKA